MHVEKISQRSYFISLIRKIQVPYPQELKCSDVAYHPTANWQSHDKAKHVALYGWSRKWCILHQYDSRVASFLFEGMCTDSHSISLLIQIYQNFRRTDTFDGKHSKHVDVPQFQSTKTFAEYNWLMKYSITMSGVQGRSWCRALSLKPYKGFRPCFAPQPLICPRRIRNFLLFQSLARSCKIWQQDKKSRFFISPQ